MFRHDGFDKTNRRETLARLWARHGTGAALSLLRERATSDLASGGDLLNRRQQPRALRFEIEARVLVRQLAGERGDPLHEIEDRRGRMPFLLQHAPDDPLAFALREAALAQETMPTLVGVRDDRGPRTREERRAGKECDSTVRSRGGPSQSYKQP